ncbi:MAG TPA: hypothetical protein VOA88_00680, partial [Candidatus Dormibacteraeota bacterium]|nr:hypothetical protein [Candidatus Dormibacteraeota bacterium]
MKKSIGRTLAHVDVAANTSVRIHEDFFNSHRIYQHLSTAANCDSPKPIGLFGTVNANSTLCRGKPRVVPPALRASGSHF